MVGRSTHKGLFKPSKPGKYKGDVSNIIYRSGYELTFMMWCDNNDNVIEWASEEVVIPYRTRLDHDREKKQGRQIFHRYFVDFYIKVKDASGGTNKYLIEIKPYHETQEPKPQGKKKRRTYLTEVATWIKNQDKWAAATSFCKERGLQFKIITEVELYGRKPK